MIDFCCRHMRVSRVRSELRKCISEWTCCRLHWRAEQSILSTAVWRDTVVVARFTHKHADTLKHTSGCHAVLHGAMITLSSTGPYTLIHLYNSLCWFPAHIHTHRKYTQYKNQWLTWWALWDTGRKRAHTHTNAHGAQWSCWQALPRQINLVYSLIWAQIAPPQAHTYTLI